ncbi:MAG: energy transducer TonB, partial [Gemmatimonadetes bacterium]|nr:energy transducer TonB [Gemmatimonadota bacterium]
REGGVDSVAVVESSGHAALDSAALLGARGMEFEPARRAGEPLRVWARVPVHFSKSAEPPAQPPLRRRR